MPDSSSILIVDDDPDNRSNVRDILDSAGFRTSIAEDGPTAIKLLEDHAFDVALIDYRMPIMDGAQLCESIRQRSPDTIAIMITAYAGSGAQRAADAGIRKILSKPVDPRQLLELIGQVLREST